MKFMSLFLGGMWGKEKDEKFNNFFLNFILVNFKKKSNSSFTEQSRVLIMYKYFVPLDFLNK